MANKNYLSVPKLIVLLFSIFIAGSAYSANESSCISQETLVITVNGQACLSTKLLFTCSAGCVPESSHTVSVEFWCASGEKIKQAVDIPTSCIRPDSKK